MRPKAPRLDVPIPDEIAKWLLGSFAAIGGDLNALPLGIGSQIFDLYVDHGDRARDLFRQHARYLRRRAVEWGIEPSWIDEAGAIYYYYEPRPDIVRGVHTEPWPGDDDA